VTIDEHDIDFCRRQSFTGRETTETGPDYDDMGPAAHDASPVMRKIGT